MNCKKRRQKKYFTSLPDDPQPIVHEVRHRLAFSEVDALAIGWHGHYPEFFEMAHTELMRKIGLTYDLYRENGIGAPIVQFHADYFAPLILDELFTIRAELVWSDGARINVNYEIIKENGQLAGTGNRLYSPDAVRRQQPHAFRDDAASRRSRLATLEEWRFQRFVKSREVKNSKRSAAI